MYTLTESCLVPLGSHHFKLMMHELNRWISQELESDYGPIKFFIHFDEDQLSENYKAYTIYLDKNLEAVDHNYLMGIISGLELSLDIEKQ